MINVKELREAMGISQAALADMVGTSQQQIDKIEKGKIKHSRIFPALERVLLPENMIGCHPWCRPPRRQDLEEAIATVDAALEQVSKAFQRLLEAKCVLIKANED